MRLLTLALLISAAAFAERRTSWEGRPALILENDKIELTVLEQGSTMPRLLLKSDPQGVSPLWDPVRHARELGAPSTFGGSIGHFVCADGFGPVSPEEKSAGLQGHGEAHTQTFNLVSAEKAGKTQSLTLRASLPIVKEYMIRKLHVVDGEQIIAVETELWNELGFDRPIVWAEHATIGSPFLAPGKTAVDLSAAECQIRPTEGRGRVPYRLPGGKNFTWPMAPLTAGGMSDLRFVPDPPNSMDHSTCRLDPNLPFAWVTALNLERRLLFGYLFKQDEYPWIQNWMNYPPNGKLARGLEFSTQPYDVPRREAISLGTMFGAPTYRWLPAQGKTTTTFWMFYTEAPEGFRKVDSVVLKDGKLILEDRTADKRIELAASRTF